MNQITAAEVTSFTRRNRISYARASAANGPGQQLASPSSGLTRDDLHG